MTAEQLMRKARIQLLFSQPFFATLLLRLELAECPGLDTMATDGKTLLYNPKFVQSLTFDELKGTLCHEVLHTSLLHHTRLGSRNIEKANMAMDAVVNPMVIEAGLVLPKGVIDWPWAKGMTWEWVYDRMPDSPSSAGQQPSRFGAGQGQQHPRQRGNGPPNIQTPGGFGQVLDSPAKTESARAAEERDWRIALQEAAMAAKAAGKLPGNQARLAEAMREPQLDWRALLRRFIEETMISDYTWARPNRRYISQDIYLPGAHREGCGALVLGTDTSGSIGKRELDAFVTEFRAIHEELKPSSMSVAYFDAAVQHVDRFMPDDEITLNPKGGGGTDFRPVFDWIAEQGDAPKCLIMLTDCMGAYPAGPPEYPVMWVRTDKAVTPPFGELVELEVNVA